MKKAKVIYWDPSVLMLKMQYINFTNWYSFSEDCINQGINNPEIYVTHVQIINW